MACILELLRPRPMHNLLRQTSVCVLAIALGFHVLGQSTARAEEILKIDFKLIYYAAQLANQAYEGKSEIIGKYPGKSAWVATPGHTYVQYVLIKNKKQKTQIIAVRGTNNEDNWNLNEDTKGVVDNKAGILIHAGFNKASTTIYSDLQSRLDRNYTTYLTGHSLGGAVASILGIYLRNDKYKIGRIYTFGQPRFTDLMGAQKYKNLPVLRLIYQNDVVSLLPSNFDENNRKYAHIGAAINLLSGPYYVYANAERALKMSPGMLGKFASQISVPDHKMKWYLNGLKEKFSGAKQVKIEDRNKYIIRHQAGKQKGVPIKRKSNFNKLN